MRKFVLGFVVGILTLPAGFLLLAWLGLIPALANADPPGWEKAFAQMTLNAYVSRHAPHLTNPVPATDENLLVGMKIFRDACAGCHGDPSATSDYGASFYPHVPQFAVRPPRKPDWQLFWIVRNGVRYSGMAIAAGTLDQPTGLKTLVQIHVNSAGDYYRIDPSIRQRPD